MYSALAHSHTLACCQVWGHSELRACSMRHAPGFAVITCTPAPGSSGPSMCLASRDSRPASRARRQRCERDSKAAAAGAKGPAPSGTKSGGHRACSARTLLSARQVMNAYQKDV